jgi:hypothetical protein
LQKGLEQDKVKRPLAAVSSETKGRTKQITRNKQQFREAMLVLLHANFD